MIERAALPRSKVPPWVHIVRKELHVYARTYYTEVTYVILFPTLLVLSLRWGIGEGKVTVAGMEYLRFIAPGVLLLAAVTTAFFNVGFIMIFEKEYSGAFQGILTCPVTVTDVVLGKVVSGATKATINGLAVTLLLAVVVGFPLQATTLLVIPLLFVTSLLFSAGGLAMGVVLRKGYQLGSIGNLVILPATFAGGMFFDYHTQLPSSLIPIVALSPVTMAIDGLRSTMIGGSGDIVLQMVGITIAFLLMFLLARWTYDATLLR